MCYSKHWGKDENAYSKHWGKDENALFISSAESLHIGHFHRWYLS